MAINIRKSISNPNALDIGNTGIQSRTVSKTIKLALFTTNENAVWAAKQQLMKESYPFALVSIPVNRNMFRLQVGDCFKFSYEPYGISNMVCRVLAVEEQSLKSEVIIIHAVEDFYSIANSITEYTAPIVDPTPSPDYDLLPFVYQMVVEAPYLLTSDIEIVPIAARASSLDIGIHTHLSLDDGVSYSLMGSAANIRPHGLLDESYSASTYTIDDEVGFIVTFSSDDVDLIETTTWPTVLAGLDNNAMLGDELITFQTITPVSGMQYKIENIIRGRLDTEKIDHSNGESFYFIGPFSMTSIQHLEIIAGSNRKFKLVPYNIKSAGNLSESISISSAIEGRAKKPYIPKNFLANGSNFASRYSADIILTWSHRHRGRGAGIGVPGKVLPDTDREGYFEVEVWVSAVLVRTATAIDATTWTYTEVMNDLDNGSPLAEEVVFKLLNYRTEDGYVYKSDQVSVTCKEGEGQG